MVLYLRIVLSFLLLSSSPSSGHTTVCLISHLLKDKLFPAWGYYEQSCYEYLFTSLNVK